MKRITALGPAILLAFAAVSYSPEADARRWRGGAAAAAIAGGFIAAGIAHRYGYYYPRRVYDYGPRYYYGSGYYVRPYYRPRVRYRVRPYVPPRIYRYYGPRPYYRRLRRW
ncbi:MAG: hypothetical protein AB7O43_04265 [Hyphomicrobiaceae bacterium]